jgi:quinolinate synthase
MTVEEMYASLKAALADVVPDVELRYKAEIAVQINQLKQEKNAVILGHNYMEPVLYHSVTDFKGDSLELSRRAAQTDKDIIVFCGVRFMAETAKILNPNKTVLLPANAGCSLAASITAKDVRDLKARFPGVPVVTYVNTYADVKAESDICCTSGNAVAVVQSLGSQTVIFLPDEYLARNVARETGKHIIFPTLGAVAAEASADNELDYQMVGWRGRCEVHEKFTVSDIRNVRQQFPDVRILAHPECSPEVIAASDFSGSTSAMIRYVENTNAPRFLLLTECSMGDNVAAANPDKNMLRLCSVRCPHMNQITMENTLHALQTNQIEINVPEDIRVRAVRAVERMIAIG